MSKRNRFHDIWREQSQEIKKSWEELKEAGKDVKNAFAELGDIFKKEKNSDEASKTEKNITKEDILSEIKATKEVIAQTQEAISIRKEAQASSSSSLRKLLEKARNNPDILLDFPAKSIDVFETSLKGLTRLKKSCPIEAKEYMADLKEFLALYYEAKKSFRSHRRKTVAWRLSNFYKSCDTIIEKIKKTYGDEAASTLDYCEKIITHNDKMIRKMRFILLAMKFYPTGFGTQFWQDIDWLSQELKELNDIENDPHASSQIKVLEELLSRGWKSIYTDYSEKQPEDYTTPENILHEANYVAKFTEGKASIVDYLGSSEDIIIPDKVQGIPVNAIDDYAFHGKKIKQASIHSGIKKIGKNAFSVNFLTHILLPDGLLSIGDYAFRANKLTEINIPPSVTSLGRMGFRENELVSAVIPASVAFIPEGTFESNTLIAVELAEGITAIEKEAFNNNCLEKIRIPDSVTSIGPSAFMSNPLKEIILPAKVEIDEAGCTDSDLTSAYIRNHRHAGVYKYQGDNWRFIPDTEIFSEWDINAYNEMEDLAIEQKNLVKRIEQRIEKIIEKIETSEKGRRLSKLQGYFRFSIPKEIWDAMPDEFREFIRKELLSEESYVSYTPILPEKINKAHPMMRLKNETITIYDGSPESRTYNARTGECIFVTRS